MALTGAKRQAAWRKRQRASDIELAKAYFTVRNRAADLEGALAAKEKRNWPADMTKRELKKRDSIQRQIAEWQHELDRLFQSVTSRK